MNGRARKLRQQGTQAEQRLWYHLRARRLAGWKFRRQHSIGPYFADFVCLDARLIVEVDGSQHLDQLASDASRSAYLESRGFRVLRFWNDEVLRQTDNVLEAILLELDGVGRQPPHPNPTPRRGEGL
ncbi:endonuclease domain-containing protein [Algiphilus sp.]|uniref:endonuclease domain-containing protein n=1 Tax=Algiphilus sp. TaxID=1872431 RepID=UPI0032EF2D37